MNLLTDETVRPKEHYRFQFDPVQRIMMSRLRKRMFFLCLFMGIADRNND